MATPSIPPSFPAGAAAKSAADYRNIRGAVPSAADSIGHDQQQVQNQQELASPASQPSNEQILKAVEQLKEALPPVARNLQFSLDSETGQTVVKVVDPATKEVIRQIPSEEVLAITKSLNTFTGLMAKQKV